ncbi:hypothetical protein [Yunchengibacter salinarum]|uniref:hypothetical protein n=1 Tax=Yunchengibacter salinarum TaxID=3133399 RepID=UPI0035B697D0
MAQRTEAEKYFPDPFGLPDLPPFDDLISWWQGLVRTHGRPTRHHIQFRDLQGWHSRLTISEALPDRSDLLVRLVGEDVADLFEGHLAPGARLSQVMGISPNNQRLHVGHLIEQGCLALTSGKIRLSNGAAIAARALDFPLTNEDGPNQVLTFYDFTLPLIFKNIPRQTTGLREPVT